MLFCGDCVEILPHLERFKCLFADPPDNLGLQYGVYDDNLPSDKYVKQLEKWFRLFVEKADITWVSYNSRWTFNVGRIVTELLMDFPQLSAKACVQTFTFGQNCQSDMGNGHRPLVRLMWEGSKLYPEAIRVASWRQLNGDKRADPRGRVPLDVFDFPRVTGNSKQRRAHFPTQLHEGLVERCVLMSTVAGERVADVFSGSGTTAIVCKRLGRECDSIELDPTSCERIADELLVPV